jgi:hypothetical protein
MCDKELLVGYLYDELESADRRIFDAHVAVCASCREEVAGLREARGQIAAWAPPEPDLGLRIVRGAAAPAPRARFSPAWGLAAAAALVLAASAAIANIEVRYGSDGVIVRTGWGRPVATPAAAPAQDALRNAAVAQDSPEWKAELAAVDERLRQLEVSVSARSAGPLAAAANGDSVSDAEIIRRVRAILAESEGRQQRELAYRIQQVAREAESQRQADFASIRQGLGQIQGTTEIEVARHREMLDYLYRVAAQQK